MLRPVVLFVVASLIFNLSIAQVTCVESSELSPFQTQSKLETKAIKRESSPDMIISSHMKEQRIDAWGGCVNELGWKALSVLSEQERQGVISQLFSDEGCAFNQCRMPIGASDYALDYYSLNDVEYDYEMTHFNIERDKKSLLPYLKMAQKYRPDLQVWGSPWTPPSWMKTNHRYNAGELIDSYQNLKAYALYFEKYVKAYRAEGIDVYGVHVQNEPYHLPVFPSCGWSGELTNKFVRDFLGPQFQKSELDCEIWLGTINGNNTQDEYETFIRTCLKDKKTAKYITGVGFQWYGDAAVEATHHFYPTKKIMQTETKCGNGSNDWSYAFETGQQMLWYLHRNTNSYFQWNMVLGQTGRSSWGWIQSALITVDSQTSEITYNPQFYMVKHFSHFIKPGAVKLGSIGMEDDAIAFLNPNGDKIIVVLNASEKQLRRTVYIDDQMLEISLNPLSVATFICK